MLSFAGRNVSRKMDGEACPAGGCGTRSFVRDHSRIGRAVELTVQASFSQLELSKFEGSLARKLRFHIRFGSRFSTRGERRWFESALRRAEMRWKKLRRHEISWDEIGRHRHRKSYWSGRIRAAMVICRQISSILALVIFLFKSFRKCFKIVFFLLWRRDPDWELQFLTPLRVVLLCFATQPLQIAL